MGHFFPTTGEVGIIFHDSRNKSVSCEMSHEANHMYLIQVRIDISFFVKTGRHCQWWFYSGAMGFVCWHVTIIVAIIVNVKVEWHWCLDVFNGVTTMIVALDVTLGFALCDKDNSNRRLLMACTGGPLHVQTSVVHRTWCHCCFSSPPRLTFGTGVDRCDDSVGHNRGCQCRHDLSLS